MNLRPYQQAAAAAVLPLLRDGKRVALALPTGAGKTVTGASIVHAMRVPTTWTAHRRELVTQALGVVPQSVTVAAVQKRNLPAASLLVIDEAHHVMAPTYRRHVDAHRGPILGLTATPYRLDGRGLGEVFDHVVHVDWPDDGAPRAVVETAGLLTLSGALIREGTLIEPRYFVIPGPSLDDVKQRAGDFAQDQSAAIMDRPKVAGCAVSEYVARCSGRRAVAFCVTVEHAAHVAESFTERGIRAEVVSGTTPKPERDAILARLRSGETHVVCTVMVLTEGWDLPALEVAIILRPTASVCLWLQMLGRVMRACDGKEGATVLDHAGNLTRLGVTCSTPVPFDLMGRAKRPSVSTGLKLCPACYMLVPARVESCPGCGHSFAGEVQQLIGDPEGIGGKEKLVEFAPPKFTDADLAEVKAMAMRLYPHDERRRYYFRLLEEARVRDYKPGWVEHRFRHWYPEGPPADWRPRWTEWRARKV